jgi:hypothetical protein
MRHLLLAALASLFTATAAPAFAASMIFDVSLSGTVASDVTSGPPLPFVFGQNLTGKPVQITQSFNLANTSEINGVTYFGSSDFNFTSADITIGNVSAPFHEGFGSFTPEFGGFSGAMGAPVANNIVLGQGGIGHTNLDYSVSFVQIQDQSIINSYVANASLNVFLAPASTRNLDFNITSATLVLPPVLSAVPLPPALPLFAFALLALGIFGYVGKKRAETGAGRSHTSMDHLLARG